MVVAANCTITQSINNQVFRFSTVCITTARVENSPALFLKPIKPIDMGIDITAIVNIGKAFVEAIELIKRAYESSIHRGDVAEGENATFTIRLLDIAKIDNSVEVASAYVSVEFGPKAQHIPVGMIEIKTESQTISRTVDEVRGYECDCEKCVELRNQETKEMADLFVELTKNIIDGKEKGKS